MKQTMKDFSKTAFFIHTHEVSKGEPQWATIDVQKLPSEAFTVIGDKEDSKTWLFPHHYIEQAGDPDEHGKWTKGRMLVHMEALQVATRAAKGNAQAERHLEAHWKTIDPDHDGHPLPDRTGVNAYFEEKSVPRYCFSAPVSMEIGSNGDTAVSAPISLIALSGEILDRPEWGPCIQDLAGLMHKDKIAIDYRHNADEVIGYINQFMVTDGKLILSGALVPQKTHCRTQEIIDNIRAGVPYEASVYFPPWKPDEMEIERVDPGESVLINGKSVTAPGKGLTIFRRWNLRGVAICPHGSDGNTAAYLQTSQALNVNVRVVKAAQKEKEQKMNKQQVMDLLVGISKETDAQKFMQTISQIAEQAEDAEQKKLAVDAVTAIGKETDAAKKSWLASGLLSAFGFKAEDAKDGDHKEPDGDEGGEGAGKEKDDDKVESYSLEEIKKFGKTFGARAHEYMGKGLKFEAALATDHAMLSKKALEAEAEAEAEAANKHKQGVKPRIKFQNTDNDNGKFGLSEKEVGAIGLYAQEFNLSDAAKKRLIEKHQWAKEQSKKYGNYSPDPNAAPFNRGASTLTKIGNE